MSGPDLVVTMYLLAAELDQCLMKQAFRYMHPAQAAKLEAEVDKLVTVGFIREVLANIVPVKRKNGQIHVCVDFWDLNKACCKEDFLVPTWSYF